MKKLFLVLFLIASILFGGFSNSSAQESNSELVTIATVNIKEAQVIAQSDNLVKVFFKLSNKNKVQPDVKYSLALMEEAGKNQNIKDERVYSEVISLSENQVVEREIVYSIPGYFQGDYILTLFVKNSSGLILDFVPIKKISAEGTGEYLQIDNSSCYLSIEGNEEKYTLSQGVDISGTENLLINCSVANNYSKAVSFSPVFLTYERSVFGGLVGAQLVENNEIALQAGEKKEFSYSVPRPFSPQAYDSVVELIGTNQEVSNEIKYHYVIQGLSATIQNITLDKRQYQKGEVAKTSFSWSPSADSFISSRASENKDNQGMPLALKLFIVNKDGEVCSQVHESMLNIDSVKREIDLNITEECSWPIINASISDIAGRELDSKRLEFGSREQQQEDQDEKQSLAQQQKDRDSQGKIILALIIALIVFIIILISMIVYRRKKLSSKPNKSKFTKMAVIAFAITFSSLFAFGLTGNARADVLRLNGVDFMFHLGNRERVNGAYAIYDDDTFYVGETVYGFAQANSSACANDGGVDVQVLGTVNGSQKEVVSASGLTDGDYSKVHGSTSWTANNVPGEYVALFDFTVNGKKASRTFSYTVLDAGCGSSDGEIFVEPPTNNLCALGSASAVDDTYKYKWECAGEQDVVACSAKKRTIDQGAIIDFTIEQALFEYDRYILNWEAINVDNCFASNSTGNSHDNLQWSGDVLTFGSRRVAPTEKMEYYLECFDADGASLGRKSVLAELKPIVFLKADSSSINSGQSVRLNWQPWNVKDCFASEDWEGNKAAERTTSYHYEHVYPQHNPSVYGITCQNDRGESTWREKRIEVKNAPSAETSFDLEFTTTKNNITAGESTTLQWVPQDAASCWGFSDRLGHDGGWTENETWGSRKNHLSGTHSQQINPQETTTYLMNCYDTNYESITRSVIVNVSETGTPSTYNCYQESLSCDSGNTGVITGNIICTIDGADHKFFDTRERCEDEFDVVNGVDVCVDPPTKDCSDGSDGSDGSGYKADGWMEVAP